MNELTIAHKTYLQWGPARKKVCGTIPIFGVGRLAKIGSSLTKSANPIYQVGNPYP